MQPIAISPHDLAGTPEHYLGLVLTHEVREGRTRLIRKGEPIAENHLEALRTLDRAIHAVRLEPDDVHERDAGIQLARMLRGDDASLTQRDPVQGRVNVVATERGLFRVDAAALNAINQHDGMGVFTLPDRLPVVPGKIVAGAKVTPVAIPKEAMDAVVEVIAGRPEPVIQLKPFLPQRVGVVVTEGLAVRVRDRFEQVVRQKIAWYGSEVMRFCYLANDERAISDAMQGLLDDGATVILTAGGNMMDPLDATLQALPAVDAHMVRLGAPAHPGSMFWLAETEGGVPLVNLASCSMYSRATVADLVLPWVMAGEQVTNADLAELGHGGLLDRDMSWRFPDYEVTSVDEPDESD